MSKLVLVRHGESEWNASNKFTGWADVSLTEAGIIEAQQLAEHCQNLVYNCAFTSKLIRAQATLLIILSKQKLTGIFQHELDLQFPEWIKRSNYFAETEIPIYISNALNERFYGDLQGMNKHVAEEKYGKEQLNKWRRGYEETPPAGESLAEAHSRMHSYFVSNVLAKVIKGETVLVAAHGNTLRAAIKHLEGISDQEIAFVDLPKAKPLVYEYRDNKFVRVEGTYDFDRPLR